MRHISVTAEQTFSDNLRVMLMMNEASDATQLWLMLLDSVVVYRMSNQGWVSLNPLMLLSQLLTLIFHLSLTTSFLILPFPYCSSFSCFRFLIPIFFNPLFCFGVTPTNRVRRLTALRFPFHRPHAFRSQSCFVPCVLTHSRWLTCRPRLPATFLSPSPSLMFSRSTGPLGSL